MLLSNLSRLIPSDFYGNRVSTKPECLFKSWKKQYQKYNQNSNDDNIIDIYKLIDKTHRKYPASIEQYTGDILLVGINYDKKTKKHECVIEQYEK